MKRISSKKNTAFFDKIGILLSYFLNIVYVIPFYAVIGAEGGVLYSYVYTIYSLFISLSVTAVPFAICNIVREYQTLGYYTAKKRAFLIGKRVGLLFGFVCFLFILIFTPMFVKLILGDLVGESNIRNIIFSIRMISSVMLVSPILGIYKGVFEGHRFDNILSKANCLERIVKFLFIIIVSFLLGKFLKLSSNFVVNVSLIGITLGVFASYFYLLNSKKRFRKKFNEKIRNVNEPIITSKAIYKKILLYAIPFLCIDVYNSLYIFIDVTTVIRGLVDLAKFSILDAEIVMSMFSVWGAIFNIVLLSLSMAVVSVFLPILTKSVEKRNYKECSIKINKMISVLLFILLPITIGISFLAEPVWMLFYGSSK